MAKDANFSSNILLIHADGNNGTANSTLATESANNYAITASGTITQNSVSPYATNWSNYFDSSVTSYLNIPANNAYTIGLNDFTMEFWFYAKSLASTQGLMCSHSTGGMFKIDLNTDGTITFSFNVDGGATSGYTTITTFNTTCKANTWYHVAVSRLSSGSDEIMTWINGVYDASSTGFSGTRNIGSFGGIKPFYVGTGPDTTNPFTGYISNFRFVNGTSLYNRVGRFFPYALTVPTTQLTAVANTKILTCQTPAIYDKSSVAASITTNGAPQTMPFSPFAPTAGYLKSTQGTGIHLNGGSYLDVTIPSTTLSGDFTVEAWVRNSGSSFTIMDASATANNFAIYWDGNNIIRFYLNGTAVASATYVFLVNVWYHMAVTRSGSTVTLWINGLNRNSGTSSTGATLGTGLRIGKLGGASTGNLAGVISNFRLVDGSALYTGTFTPPAAPVTAVSGTIALVNGDNANVYDNTMNSVVFLTGATKNSTAQYISSPSSLVFDGSGRAYALASPLTDFTSGNFTVECWIYPTTFATEQAIINKGTEAGPAAGAFTVRLTTNGTIRTTVSINGSTAAADSTSTLTVNLNQWNHIAFVCNNNSYTRYINGASAGGFGGVYSLYYFSTYYVHIGGNGDGTQYFTGYIDEIRLTKGVARYTAAFVPNTFPNQ